MIYYRVYDVKEARKLTRYLIENGFAGVMVNEGEFWTVKGWR